MTTYSTISQYTKATAKKVSAYLGPLLDHALQFVPRKKIEETPLFVLATGGMRRLKQQHYDEFAIPRAAIIDCISLGNFSIRRMIPSPGMTKGFTDGLLSTTWTTPRRRKNPMSLWMGGESAQFAVTLELEDYSK